MFWDIFAVVATAVTVVLGFFFIRMLRDALRANAADKASEKRLKNLVGEYWRGEEVVTKTAGPKGKVLHARPDPNDPHEFEYYIDWDHGYHSWISGQRLTRPDQVSLTKKTKES